MIFHFSYQTMIQWKYLKSIRIIKKLFYWKIYEFSLLYNRFASFSLSLLKIFSYGKAFYREFWEKGMKKIKFGWFFGKDLMLNQPNSDL